MTKDVTHLFEKHTRDGVPVLHVQDCGDNAYKYYYVGEDGEIDYWHVRPDGTTDDFLGNLPESRWLTPVGPRIFYIPVMASEVEERALEASEMLTTKEAAEDVDLKYIAEVKIIPNSRYGR